MQLQNTKAKPKLHRGKKQLQIFNKITKEYNISDLELKRCHTQIRSKREKTLYKNETGNIISHF